MPDKDVVIEQIRVAFGENQYPGDSFLQGSFDGCEPAEAVAPFKGHTDWQSIPSVLLDANYATLSFFSEAALRFFLPAYLIADVRGELHTADPLFVLIHGFSDASIKHQVKTRTFVRKIGKTAFINPRRYGGITFNDYARYRLSVFTQEEATAIIAYLHYKRATDPDQLYTVQIDAALSGYWIERAQHAPTRACLRQYLAEEAEYMTALTAATSEHG
ncbi:MAG: hypothetical protein AB7G75_00850 [Candidatus Binatia bacterium]